jgi:thioredoxin 1
MSSVASTTQKTFVGDVLNAPEVVLVDFWAEWCPPCKALNPVLENIAAELDPALKILKLNVDENPELALEYQVIAIPMMKIFRDGLVVGTITGAKPAAALRHELDRYLEAPAITAER